MNSLMNNMSLAALAASNSNYNGTLQSAPGLENPTFSPQNLMRSQT